MLNVKNHFGREQVKFATIIAIEKILFNTYGIYSFSREDIVRAVGEDFYKRWIDYTEETDYDYIRTFFEVLEEMNREGVISKFEMFENHFYTVNDADAFENYAVRNLKNACNNTCGINLLSKEYSEFAKNLCNPPFNFDDEEEPYEEDFDDEEEPYEEDFDEEEEPYEEDFDEEEEPYEEDFDDEEEPYEEDFDDEEEPYEEDFDDEEEPYEEDFDDEEEPYEEDFDDEEEPYEEDFDDEEEPYEEDFDDEEEPYQEDFDDEEEPYEEDFDDEEEPYQDNNSIYVLDEYERDKENKFAFEFIRKYIEHNFLGGNGRITYSKVRSLINFCEKIIEDADFCLENYEMEKGDYVITDIEKIKELLVINSDKQGSNFYETYGKAIIGHNKHTKNYFIKKGSVLPPLSCLADEEAFDERDKMLEKGYLTRLNDGNYLVNKNYIFPLDYLPFLITVNCLGR